MIHYNGSIRSKLPQTDQSIFSLINQHAAKAGALNLSQGFPDFDMPEDLINRVHHYMKKGHNQYAPMPGHPGLLKKIAEKTKSLYGCKYDAEKEITITAGATQAIYAVIASLINEDDEVIIFTPAYDCYEPAIKLNGGKPVFVQLKLPDYCIDWEEVKKVINQKTRMIIINTPHNPTGTVLSKNDLSELEKIVKGTDIFVLSDEVYEHVVFDDNEHNSVMQSPELAAQSIVVSSFGKTYHCTGWKIGYCLAPENIMKEIRKAHQFIVFAVNTPIQYALADYMDKSSHYLKLGEFYQKKRDYFNGLLKNSKFEILPSAGTYFQLLRYDAISDMPDNEYALHLIKKYKIAAIPVSVFYHSKVENHVLRFCFAKEKETLKEAAEILNSVT